MLLVGDIGGTKTVLALFSADSGPNQPFAEKNYPSGQYPSLEAIISAYLSEVNAPIDRGCFGVAGPVTDGRARITNLPWVIEETVLKTTFGWKSARLLNDLEAVAYAVPILKPEDIYTLFEGEPAKNGSIAIIAPGTGLGEAFLSHTGDHYIAHPSEGAHASFGPIDAQQTALLVYMRERKGFDHVSYERVCSGGLGLPNIYNFLKDTGFAEEPAWLGAALAGNDDPTPVIVKAAQNNKNPDKLCAESLALFARILASEAGNMALKVLATAGIYLGGGISPRILAQLQNPEFLTVLRNKGRFTVMLAKVPVKVILNAKAGLYGAAAFGLTI